MSFKKLVPVLLLLALASQAGAQTLDFLRSHIPEPRTVPLCGNSIGTDRRFLAAYLPDIENHLHYRSIDVSSVKELVKRWLDLDDEGRIKAAYQWLQDSIVNLRYDDYYDDTYDSGGCEGYTYDEDDEYYESEGCDSGDWTSSESDDLPSR